jgi:hypothetical protein
MKLVFPGCSALTAVALPLALTGAADTCRGGETAAPPSSPEGQRGKGDQYEKSK